MNAEQAQRDRLRAWTCVAALLPLGLLAWLRPLPAPPVPPRLPLSAAQPWMADCLPGVGPKTRERMAAALRAGRISDLPRQARNEVEMLFEPSER